MTMIDADNICDDLQKIRSKSPLIHNITNFVTMDIMANSLLTLGASPIMAHASSEIEEVVKAVQGININIGTLEDSWIKAMIKTATIAKDKKIPVVLDPVGAGFTQYRTQAALALLDMQVITVVRGNASEILSLVSGENITKGVDNNENDINKVADAAKHLSSAFNTIVVITGQRDYIICNEEVITVEYGHSWMSKVTGMGCALSSVIAAFLAVNNNYFRASVNAVSMFGIVGQLVADFSAGPASFKTNFIDKLHNITSMEIKNTL
ncbi:Hydroxyethylthiazole kinase [Rickettsiales bacterium Ac37b]|nr:Hydroxyethylthiazole kinase [Rickettsiales bacterium Ac37b]